MSVFGKRPLEFSPLEPAIEDRLGTFVREIEKFVRNAVPERATDFQLTVNAELVPNRPPHYETRGSLSCPRDVYEKVWHGLPEHVLPPSQGDELSVSLEFVIHAKSA